MSTLDNIRHGIGRAFESLAEGWHHLQERATEALTRFTPVRRSPGAMESRDEQRALYGARWGLLAADLSEEEEKVVVQLEVAGMEKQDFEIAVDGRVLTVFGEKRVEREERQGQYHLLERAYGRFQRSIPLPTEVDQSRARAVYERGVLRVELPKLVRGGARRIPVSND